MAQPNSELWQMNELSPEDEIFSNVQVNSEEEPLDMFGSGSEDEFSIQTPEQKPTTQDHISGTYLNSGKDSSDISTKEESEAMSSSSSSSSSDAESGTYTLPTQKYSASHVNDGQVLRPIMIETEAESFDMKENLHKSDRDGETVLKEKDIVYEKLLEKVATYETELRITKNKLQASEDEIAKLKYENLTLAEELGMTIEKLQISEVNMKEMEIKFTNDFQEGQAHLQAKIDLANQSINLLQAELSSERNHSSELQEMVAKTANDLSDYSREVDELKVVLRDAQNDFSKEKSQFQSDIAILQTENNALNIGVNDVEMRCKMLGEQIKQCEVEKAEMKKFHEAREATLLDEIEQFNMKVCEKNQIVDSLNKNLDSSKLKYDMLMSEKDEIFAKLETLQAEIKCRDINIQQLEEHISKLRIDQDNLVAMSQKSQKVIEELGLKVMEQEKELEKQRDWICERGDEKREAIRQLCLSIEYYRSEYHELRQALLKHKPLAVMAS
ncbi:protein NETWORKED 4A-like [Silene latifolia]|uniref:protein NETWORKED 4A-like n=1 Tax=Silene latifolia TaxID=37657 RepID=UPI003D77E2EB